MEYSFDPVDINVRFRIYIYIFEFEQKYGIHTYNYLLIQAKRDKLNINKLNPPGVFKKNKGKRDLGEKYDSKFYPSNYKNNVLYSNYNDLLDNLYMEKKGIDFGLRSYKNYNKKNCKNKINKKDSTKQMDKNNNETEKINKDDENELMKKYVNNQFTFKQNYENNFNNKFELNDNLNNNQDINLEPNNININQQNDLENQYNQNYIENENNNYEEHNPAIIQENNNINENFEFEDIRLYYVMEKLGLESLIPIFEQYHMSFNDILFLTKDDLNELGLKIFQKNRLISFIEEYSSKAKSYTLEEIQTFFEENRIYNISNNQE